MAVEEELLTEILGVRVVSTDAGLRFESTDESGSGTVTLTPDQFTRLQDAHRKSRQGRVMAFGLPLTPDERYHSETGVLSNEFVQVYQAARQEGDSEPKHVCGADPDGPLGMLSGHEARADSPQAAVDKYTRRLRALAVTVRGALKQVESEVSPETESTDPPT